MGKIFGISDLPVSTIMSAFDSVDIPKPIERKLSPIERNKLSIIDKADCFISKNARKTKTLKAFMKRLFMK